MRIALAREHRIPFDPREKNSQTIADLGLMPSEVGGVLRRLTVEDYCEGPLPDDKGRPLEWWVFGPVVSGCCLYVKVSLHKGRVICKSFHLPQWEMKYPLRGK